jgi:heme exporter protein CcmD
MIEKMLHFFQMGGYGAYVFGAYGCVLALLLLQWFIPWRRWQQYLHAQNNNA